MTVTISYTRTASVITVRPNTSGRRRRTILMRFARSCKAYGRRTRTRAGWFAAFVATRARTFVEHLIKLKISQYRPAALSPGLCRVRQSSAGDPAAWQETPLRGGRTSNE